MKKLICLMVASAIVLVINGHQKRCQANAYQKNPSNAEDSTLKVPSPPRGAEVKQVHPEVERNGTKDDAEGYFSRLLSPQNLPSLLLFAAGLGGITVALLTLFAIKRQSKATEEAARASQRYVELFIDKERARITVKPRTLSEMAPTRGARRALMVEYKLFFYCPTPAIINEARIQAYAPVGAVGPGDSLEDMGIGGVIDNTREVDQNITVFNAGDESLVDRVRDGELPVFFSGYVLYRDVFQPRDAKPHEVKFRFRWTVAESDMRACRPGHWDKFGGDAENYET